MDFIEDQKKDLIRLLKGFDERLESRLEALVDIAEGDVAGIADWINFSYDACKALLINLAMTELKAIDEEKLKYVDNDIENLEWLSIRAKIPGEITSCMETLLKYKKMASSENYIFGQSDAYLMMQITIRAFIWYHDGYNKNIQEIGDENDPNPVCNRVIIWNDMDTKISQRISGCLKKDFPEINIRVIEKCDELVKMNLSNEVYLAIILIVADQTKLSHNEKVREAINRKLVDFVNNGGSIIGTHDLIYKRSKNRLLQEVFGCTITEYSDIKNTPVIYVKCESDYIPAEFKSLPYNLKLNDNEVITGNWSPACTVIYNGEFVSDANTAGPARMEKLVPLVTLNDYGTSACVWINSGHFHKKPPDSVCKPEKDFISLLLASLKYFYNKKAAQDE